MNEDKKIWGIHAKDDNLFLEKNIIAIGWKEVGDLNKIDANRDAFKEKYTETYPNAKKGSMAIGAGMLYRFCHEMQIGDYIVFPSKRDRKVNIGVVEGMYFYDSSLLSYPQTRKVKWLEHLPRTAFSQGALYEISSAMSFFAIKNYADEFISALDKDFDKNPSYSKGESIGATVEDTVESTKDFILQELGRQLKGHDFEEFIADLLRAMGYRTEVTPQGGDRGIDIKAYKDELPPRILVQVKSCEGDIKETTIQSLKGAMREGDYGLFITLSNYTKNATSYLDSTPIIRGINGSELADLILKYYEDLSEKYRNMIPLTRVYIPVVKS